MWLYGQYNYRSGWVEGRANLVSQQQQKAQAELAKKTRQLQNDTKAAAAESEGKEMQAITREVIKYVTRPGRTVCEFPPERVSIKRRAAENANSIRIRR